MKKARFLDAVLNQLVGKLVPAILLSIVFICAPRAEEAKAWLTYDDWSIGYFMNDMGVPQAFTRAVQNSDTAVLEFTYNGNLGSPGNYHSIDIYLYGSFGYKDTDRLAFKMLMKAGGLVGTVNGGGWLCYPDKGYCKVTANLDEKWLNALRRGNKLETVILLEDVQRTHEFSLKGFTKTFKHLDETDKLCDPDRLSKTQRQSLATRNADSPDALRQECIERIKRG